MTPADLALANAIHFEGVQYAYRKTRDGVVISFVVHPHDVPKGLADAPIGSRYIVALVQVGDDEQPVHQPESEVMPHSRESVPTGPNNAQPQPDKAAGAKRKPWETLLPQQQAGMRINEPAFSEFLKEVYPSEWRETSDANECLKLICGVASKKELELKQASRVIWHQLDGEFQAWERLGA